MLGRPSRILALPALVIAAAIWDAHRSDVGTMDVFFGAVGGFLFGTILTLRQLWPVAVRGMQVNDDVVEDDPSDVAQALKRPCPMCGAKEDDYCVIEGVETRDRTHHARKP